MEMQTDESVNQLQWTVDRKRQILREHGNARCGLTARRHWGYICRDMRYLSRTPANGNIASAYAAVTLHTPYTFADVSPSLLMLLVEQDIGQLLHTDVVLDRHTLDNRTRRYLGCDQSLADKPVVLVGYGPDLGVTGHWEIRFICGDTIADAIYRLLLYKSVPDPVPEKAKA